MVNLVPACKPCNTEKGPRRPTIEELARAANLHYRILNATIGL